MPLTADIEGYLIKDDRKNTVSVCSTVPAGLSVKEKPAYIKTSCRLLDSNDRISLAEIDLITGRPHQIRAHLASEGHPIIGDPKYGKKEINRIYAEKYGISCQLLHSFRVCFEGMHGELAYLNNTEIKAPLPLNMKKMIKGEGLCLPGLQED